LPQIKLVPAKTQRSVNGGEEMKTSSTYSSEKDSDKSQRLGVEMCIKKAGPFLTLPLLYYGDLRVAESQHSLRAFHMPD